MKNIHVRTPAIEALKARARKATAMSPRVGILKPVKRKSTTLPLGVDIGTHRVRVALLERSAEGAVTLRAVAARELPSPLPREYGEHVSKLLVTMLGELGTAERRCVLGVRQPDAVVRRLPFPRMSRVERERAARFEIARFVEFPIDQAHIRVEPHPEASTDFLVGAVRRGAMDERMTILHAAKLKPVAVDHDAFAWKRAVPHYDALLDIGLSRATLHVFGTDLPYSETFTAGGDDMTEAIGRALGIDRESAERRKRTLGLAGAGEYARDRLVELLASAFIELRASGFTDVRSLGLAGNGARLIDIADDIERVTAVRTELVEFPTSLVSALPPDVTRAAAPDWMLAYGLALHAHGRIAVS